MASFFLAADPVQSTFFIPGGAVPGNGVQLFTYVAGSVSTKTTVYKDNAGSAQWTNPIVLDSGGNLPNGGVVWIPAGVAIKAVWAPSNDTDPPSSPYRTIDNMAGINDVTSANTEWTAGPTPTFVSAASFTLVGDQTGTFTVNRRLKFTVTAGTVYGRITASVFGALTTVTVKMDSSQALDAGLSAVFYSTLSANILSVPSRIATSTSGRDVYTANVGIAGYNVGDTYAVTFSSTNTSGTPNMNLDGLGAQTLTSHDGSALRINDLFGAHLLQKTSTAIAVLNPRTTPLHGPLQGYCGGLTLSTAGSSSTMSTGVGIACDTSTAFMMSLTSATWKITSSWAAGPGNGGLLDPGALSTNAWYHHFVFGRPDTGGIEVGYSSSAVLPPLPASYTLSRRIGSAKTNTSGTWTAFTQDGDLFQWSVPTNVVNSSNPGTLAVLFGGNVPIGINVVAWYAALVNNATNNNIAVYFSDPAVADSVPDTNAFFSILTPGAGATSIVAADFYTRTDTSGRVRYRLSASGASDLLRVATKGWIDRRGRDT